jgi:hypothetical protein
MTCDEVRMSLGVHALGALDAEESAEVEAHLTGCPDCQAEAAELSGLTSMLARVTEQDIEHAARPPKAVLDRMLSATATRRRRSRIWLSLAASAVVVALGGTVWVTSLRSGGEEEAATAARPLTSQESAPDRAARAEKSAPQDEPAAALADQSAKAPAEITGKQGKVRLGVRLTAEEGGTKVEATVSGVAAGTRCRLLAIGRDGAAASVAAWKVTPQEYRRGQARFDGSTDLLVTEIQRFELVTSGGRTLVTISL